MNIFSWLGRKTAIDQASKEAAEQSYLLPPSSETLKSKTEKDKKKTRKALKRNKSRNSQSPYRYGRKVKKREDD
jgi:hypothetical protein